MNRKNGFNTRAIHDGGERYNSKNALNPPIYQTSTFTFRDTDHVKKVMSFESDDYVYTRGNNPTLRLLENKIASLENGKAAVAFSSGMAAISSTLFSLLSPGDNVIINKTLYGSTFTVATKLLPKYKVGYKVCDLTDIVTLESKIDENTKVIYFETPANPNLGIIDIQKVSEIAKKHDIKVVVDNTFATPYLQRPLDLGADVVVHSATKYLSGHGDVVAGISVSKDLEYIHRLKFDYMCEFGGVMSPFNGWLILRGIKTLGIRMDRHVENAKKVVEFLKTHGAVKEVYYPGDENFKGHDIAKKQMKDFGAIISFEVNGDIESAKKVIDNMNLAKLAVSLGDCETLIELPAAMTHLGYDREKLKEFGLTDTMIRISVGIEDCEDIIYDLNQALNKII